MVGFWSARVNTNTPPFDTSSRLAFAYYALPEAWYSADESGGAKCD
jgi:hypothetical protein